MVLAAHRPPTSATTRSRTCRRAASASARCRASRAGHLRRRAGLGALLPDRVRRPLWDALWDAGPRARHAAGGYRAIDALRVEKGYRGSGADITPDDNPYEAGLGFAVDSGKRRPSSGSDALRAAKAAGPARACAPSRSTDPLAVALGSDRCASTARSVGRGAMSGGYGYSRLSIAYVYVPAADCGSRSRSFRGDQVFGNRSRRPLCAIPFTTRPGRAFAGRLPASHRRAWVATA